ETLGYRCERGRRRPGVQRRGLGSFDVVQVELCDQREIETDALALDSEIADVLPGGGHVLLFHVAEPPSKDRQPVAEFERHARLPAATAAGSLDSASSARATSASTSFSVGSKPSTRTGSATKLDSALMS